MRKNQTRGLIALVIIAVVYSVIVFAVPFITKGGVFWLSYLFTLLSMVAAGYAAYKAFCAGGDAKSKFYGFPIAKVGVVYCIVQLVLGLVFMCIPAVPVWLPVVLYIVLLGAAALGFIATDAVREEIERQDVQLKKDVSAMRALQSKANALPGLCRDDETRRAVEKFAESLRYSDPVSSEAIQDAEAELTACVAELENAIVDGDNASALTLCTKAETLLSERNRLCKLEK
jgi:hypothetical protein